MLQRTMSTGSGKAWGNSWAVNGVSARRRRRYVRAFRRHVLWRSAGSPTSSRRPTRLPLYKGICTAARPPLWRGVTLWAASLQAVPTLLFSLLKQPIISLILFTCTSCGLFNWVIGYISFKLNKNVVWLLTHYRQYMYVETSCRIQVYRILYM